MTRVHFWSLMTTFERTLIRMAMIALGLLLMVGGLAMGVSIVMLPVGLVVGFSGVGIFVWGVLGDLPVD